ncbi:hypothetical protein TorRG33x02_253450, partial [Trema orientale]
TRDAAAVRSQDTSVGDLLMQFEDLRLLSPQTTAHNLLEVVRLSELIRVKREGDLGKNSSMMLTEL